MEKCSFCVQRIRRGVRTAKKENRDLIDGEIQTACSQACPTSALVFGDLNDNNSAVSKMKHDERTYKLLPHLNLDQNVVYLAKVDPEKKIESHSVESGSHD
jgi:molybdopterin-containing oxidoreductase family iron-sulfur binding subunit|tara:strand:+ start:204 stop:506 length:303 start_codon:yes stop_codon:yes gene_type:complete